MYNINKAHKNTKHIKIAKRILKVGVNSSDGAKNLVFSYSQYNESLDLFDLVK